MRVINSKNLNIVLNMDTTINSKSKIQKKLIKKGTQKHINT